MQKQFDSKTGGLKNFLSSTTAILFVFAMIFSTSFKTIAADKGGSAETAAFSEGFEDITLLTGRGWFLQNNSVPVGSTGWFQGNTATFVAQAGPTNSYIGANFNNTTGANTISNWLLTPTITPLSNGDVFTFYTRTTTGNPFPDRLQVRLSTNGASTNVGTTATSVGDFTTLLLDINPTYQTGGVYPETFTQYTITISGLSAPTSGRLGFRYFVEDGGPAGDNSNYIGIDTFSYTPNTAPPPAKALVDYNGDGRTDFSVTRPATPASATAALSFYNKLNLANNTGAETAIQFGLGYGTYIGGASALGDVAVPADYDGDGKDDIAVWRAAAAPNAFFYILQSSNNTVRYEQFGTTGDNPTTVGDWDGDGKADVSTYRPAAAAGSQSTFFYRGSLNNTNGTVTYLPFGTNTDVATPGDYDNDGKMDASVYRAGATGVQGTFITRASGTGTITYTSLGTGASGIVARAGAPIGDYDGDGKDDYAIVRPTGTGGNLVWSILNSSNGTITTTTFGAQATDLVSPGDYDGDGKADIAVWRSGSGTDAGYYFILQSSTGTVRGVKWGTSTTALSVPDTPVQFNFEH